MLMHLAFKYDQKLHTLYIVVFAAIGLQHEPRQQRTSSSGRPIDVLPNTQLYLGEKMFHQSVRLSRVYDLLKIVRTLKLQFRFIGDSTPAVCLQ